MGRYLVLKPHVVPHKFVTSQASVPVAAALTNSAKKRKMENISNLTKKFIIEVPSTEPCSSKSVVRQLFVEGDSPPKEEPEEHFVSSPSGVFKVSSEKRKAFKSVAVQCKLRPTYRSVATNTVEAEAEVIVKTEVVETLTSPLAKKSACDKRGRPCIKKSPTISLSSESSQVSDFSSIKSSTATGSSTGSEELTDTISQQLKEERKRTSVLLCKLHSRFYLGVPKDSFNIIQLVCEQSSLQYNHVLITLRKIRLNEPYFQLALEFGTSITQIHNIFVHTVPKLADLLQNLVFWPDSKAIIKLLPIAFRARYAKVQSIIDCFEIEIEKPSAPVLQASTWSDYKQCNTIKFLISSTPNGFINFISEPYPGRISDKTIVEQSKYLEHLPDNCQVLADRGFKHINSLLQNKGCLLLRPPSVSATKKSSKMEVKQSKRIASLRIHIERVIKRLREFNYAKPHACINHSLIYLSHHIIIIICAIVNLQNPIIK